MCDQFGVVKNMKSLFGRRKLFFWAIGLSLFLTVFVTFNRVTEHDYGFEQPPDGWDDDEGENYPEPQHKILSKALIDAKLRSLADGLQKLTSEQSIPVVIKGTHSYTLFDRIFRRWKFAQDEICDRFHTESRWNRPVLVSPWLLNNTYDVNDVTMVIHMNVGKASILDVLLSFWAGPVSVGIDIHPFQTNKFLSELSSKYKDWAMRDNLDLHFMLNDGIYYPSNALRQFALNNAKTRYVFLNDVDFIPQHRLYRELRKLRDVVDTSKTVYVVPAFEYLAIPDTFPETKKELFKEWEAGNIQPFHYRWYPLQYGHRATNYKRWISAEEPYQIEWEMFYEPYVFAEAASLPEYDTRFMGRYYDKSSFFDKIRALGFNFTVLPNVFIIHYIHPVHHDYSYLMCAENLFYKTFLPEIKKLWEEREKYPWWIYPKLT